MTESPKVQSNNVAGGDIAGGDIFNTTLQATFPTALREMAHKFKEQSKQDKDMSSFIERLQHFLSEAPEFPSRDLQQKLASGGRPDVAVDALKLKEQFTKKLVRFQFSEQAQQIFAHILSKIHAFFLLHVVPKQKDGATRSQIDAMIYDDLLSPIYDEVGSCGLIDLTDLQGMVYFLGGNCHIRWD